MFDKRILKPVGVSLGEDRTHTATQRRVEVRWKAANISFDLQLFDREGKSVSPCIWVWGRQDNREHKVAYAEFSEKEFSQIKIRAFRRDKKIRFSGLSFNPGTYTRPTVTEVAP